MPRKRVNLSLDDETYSTISAYADILGTTPTRVIHEVLKEVVPTFKSLTDIANRASEDRTKAITDLQSLVISKVASISTDAAELSNKEEQLELINDND